jgi:hypothetical protein
MNIYEFKYQSLITGNYDFIKFSEKTDKKAIEKGMNMYFKTKIFCILRVINSSNKIVIFKNNLFKELKKNDRY